MDADTEQTERDIVEMLSTMAADLEEYTDDPAQIAEADRQATILRHAAREITRLRAQPSPREAIELIEKRRENYIRENCKSIGIGGDWEGTVAQEEYIAELDDIIEMLRTADTKGK